MANEENFHEVRHRQVATNGITMHVAEQGDLSAPTVLLIHGFPELWLSWRHQMAALAANGYRAIAPDLRGYGDTDVPADPAAYTIFHIVGDLIGLLDHLELPRSWSEKRWKRFLVYVGGDGIINEDLNRLLRRSDINKAILVPTGIIPTSSITYLTWSVLGIKDHVSLTTAILEVFVVGHDWGAIVAWHLCLFRPDRVKALVNMAYPYLPRHPSIKPTDRFKALGEGFYITQFQEPGRAETSIDKYGALTILKKIFSIKMENLCALPGMEIMDFLEAPTSLPEWISEDELQYFAEKFQKNGFTGPLNYYRNFDTNWTLTAPWQGAKILVPTKFIVGDKDIGFKSFGTEMHIKSGGFKAIVPDLDVIILNGGYHFIQQEKAEEVTSEILSYFSSLS